MKNNNYQWYSAIFDDNGNFDGIVENRAFKTIGECQKAIEDYMKDDVKHNWNYTYYDPKMIYIEE